MKEPLLYSMAMVVIDKMQALVMELVSKKHNSPTINLCSLLELWREYKHGLDGKKPAEKFTIAECNSPVGGVKQKWYRHNVVWQCIARSVCGWWRYGSIGWQSTRSIKRSRGTTLV